MHTIVGTTDTPIDHPSYEPRPFDQEIEFILETASLYLSRPPKREDILSTYAGIRPLVKVPGNHKTESLSRDRTIHIDDSGLLTIIGGKWTTYRRMAEDCVNHANTNGDLKDSPCVTFDLKVHGYYEHPESLGSLAVYGSDAAEVRAMAEAEPELAKQLHPQLPYTCLPLHFQYHTSLSTQEFRQGCKPYHASSVQIRYSAHPLVLNDLLDLAVFAHSPAFVCLRFD